jgi:hypothetical protein
MDGFRADLHRSLDISACFLFNITFQDLLAYRHRLYGQGTAFIGQPASNIWPHLFLDPFTSFILYSLHMSGQRHHNNLHTKATTR